MDWNEPAQDGVILSIRPVENRKMATIRVGSFYTVSQEEQENAVAHELCHCILEPLWHTVTTILDDLSPSQAKLAREVVADEFEKAIDKLADVLAPIHGVFEMVRIEEAKEGGK